jgi:uncharacterized protein (DUF1330 family)
MHQRIALGLATLAGIAIGATAIQGLHAQAKPPAYVVVPILKINDPDAFKAGVADKAGQSVAAAGGRWVVRTDKFISVDGTPPQRLAIIAFDSVEKAQAYENAAIQKEISAARMKSTNSLSFIVEGYAN